jgi:hypothetical protein
MSDIGEKLLLTSYIISDSAVFRGSDVRLRSAVVHHAYRMQNELGRFEI